MKNRTHLFTTISVLFFTLITSVVWFMNPPIVTKGDTEGVTVTQIETPSYHTKGKHVVINLNLMTLELHDSVTIVATVPLLSQGRPGSYYETIGGTYTNDYKTPLHFSSIGHVYMPYSVHLFGNYFIHGVPYYPNGEKVSSTYSGGCIRLADEDAKLVYDFIDRGTPITITRGNELSFIPTQGTSDTLISTEMTNLMVASISLEYLTQDNKITDTDGVTTSTRRTILPRLVQSGDVKVAHLYARSIGEQAFVSAMNAKAEAIGLSATHFIDVDSPVTTTYEDYDRFMSYITTYKSYLRELQKTEYRPLR